MRISIVTISFNQGDFLEDCIRSVLAQSYDNFEYIVIDPGSTDHSREILREYSHDIDTLLLEPDAGPADGLNKGLSYASGEIIGYINSDDLLLPEALDYVADFFSHSPSIDVLLGGGFLLDISGRKTRRIHSTIWTPALYAYGAAVAVQQGTFFRASAFGRTNGFNVENRTCWDGELLVDLALSGARFRTVRKALGGFRMYEDSITGSGRMWREYQEDKKRIKDKVVSRSLGFFDVPIALALKGYVYLRHPLQTFSKLMTRVTIPK